MPTITAKPVSADTPIDFNAIRERVAKAAGRAASARFPSS